MDCPSCQFDNPQEMKFCGGCGAALGNLCAACGAQSPAEARFCGQCGAPRGVDRAERRQLTVMFCDLVESTALSMRMDPEDLREVVGRYQRAVGEVVESYSGYVAQYLGDGLLIYFGYPRAHEDDPRRAVMCALETIRSLARLSHALVDEGGPALAVRIGVHTGAVVAGEIGEGESLALGSTPNVAARVQGMAQPGEVLISEATHSRVERLVQCARLGPQSLQGLAEPVVLFRALEPSREEIARGPTPEAERTPFVGREKEFQTLLGLFEAARAGRGQVALVKGEAGLGKSRLQQEFQWRVEGDAETWLTLWCSPDHQNSSLYAITSFLERWLELGPADVAKERLALLEQKLRALDFPLEESVPLLGALLSLQVDAYDASSSSPERKRSRTLEVLVELVRHVASRGSLVFAVEDLHWADPSTLEFLALLIERIASDRVFCIFTFRPEFTAGWQPQPHQSLIELQRISDHDAARMVSAWNLGRALGAEARRELVQRTDGVPLFLEELTKAVLDSDLLRQGISGTSTEKELSELIPNTLRDSLTARLDALGDAKEVAQLGALLGRDFDYELLEAVSSLDRGTLRDHLVRVLDSGLVYRTGQLPQARFHFKHALIRDSAYDSLLKSRRRQLHDQVVRVLAERFPSIVESEPETLARHCEEAGRLGEAVDAFQRAAERGSERWAYVEASHNFRRAIALLAQQAASPERDERELDLLNLASTPIAATQGYGAPELRELYSHARDLVTSLGERVDELPLMYNFWGFHCVHADRRETFEAADQILELSRRSDRPFTKAVANWVVGGTAFYAGDHPRALEYLDPAAEFYRAGFAESRAPSRRLSDALFLAWLVRGLSQAISGHPGSTADLREAVAHAEKGGEPFVITQALSHRIAAAIVIGSDPAEIGVLAARELSISVEHRLPQTLNSGRLNVAWAAAIRGDDFAIDEARDAIAAQRTGSMIAVPPMLVNFADALFRVGQADQALPAVEEALQLSTGLCRYFEAPAHELKGELLWSRGDRAAGEACLHEALRVARDQGAKMFELRAASTLTRLLREDGRAALGRVRLAGLVGELEEQSEGRHLRNAKTLLDELSDGTPDAGSSV